MLLWLAAAAGWCGCAGSKVSFQHASFTRASLQAGRVGVAAVGGWGAGEIEGAEEMAYAVRERLIAHDPLLEVIPNTEVRGGFAPGGYARLLRELYDKPRWVAQDFAGFDWLTNRVRYLLFVTILDTDVSSGDVYGGGWQEDQDYDPITRTYRRRSYFTPFATEWYSRRWTKASFLIYDLRLRQPVWEVISAASLRAHKSESSFTEQPRVPSGPGSVSLIGGLDNLAMRVVEKLPKQPLSD
jgi:hypothetical protein